jgi:acyl phosphate:glycerol-3-phosphate acyltransferase
MSVTFAIAAAAAAGYLLGSLSPAYILGRLIAGIDIREKGFKNAGVRNVKATLGLWPAAVTAVIDVGKGIAAVAFSQRFLGLPEAFVAVPVAAAVAGHIAPFYLRFRGGKGTATAIGAFLWFTAWEIGAGRFRPVTFGALLAVALVMYLASRSGDVAGMVSFLFMLVVTPLELGWSGVGILNMGLSLFMLVSMTITAVRRGIFRLEKEAEIRVWRLAARPFALLFIPIDQIWGRRFLLILVAAVCLCFIVMDLVRLLAKRSVTVLFKPGEVKRFSSMTYFLLAAFISFLVFPGIIAHLGLIYTTVGDLFGKLVGLRFGRTVVARGKTLQGSLAFFGGSLMASYLLSLVLPVPLLFVVLGSAFAAAVELFSVLLDDNFSVSILTGGLLLALRFFLKL